MDEAQVHAALAAVVDFATACNTYIEMTAPWKLAKDPERAETLDHVLYALAESLRITAVWSLRFCRRLRRRSSCS
jgi:methionyl-tRNA synthetase